MCIMLFGLLVTNFCWAIMIWAKKEKIYGSFLKTLTNPNKLHIPGTNNHFGHSFLIHIVPYRHSNYSTKYYNYTYNSLRAMSLFVQSYFFAHHQILLFCTFLAHSSMKCISIHNNGEDKGLRWNKYRLFWANRQKISILISPMIEKWEVFVKRSCFWNN